jgi:outer membrane protein OmpA-like peptidoglycan-associated protein
MKKFPGLMFALLMLTVTNIFAQEPTLYPDGRGSKVLFPLGEISFADEVISFNYGNPHSDKAYRTEEGILNIPDYDEQIANTTTTLGCGGEIILKFTDNVIIDVDGPDLFVFETGPAIEATKVFISKNGNDWLDVGILNEGKSDVDISDKVNKTDVFRYVKLVDLREDCGGNFPGADIDAVGAIGSVISFSLNSSVLFDTGKFELKSTGELDELVEKLINIDAEINIEGHTDNVGTPESNQVLSEQRASSVKSFLVSKGISKDKISIFGFGEEKPIASNKTEEGKQLNRRVEVTVKSGNAINYNEKMAGVWETNNGTLHLYQVGEKVIGWYTIDNGEMYGTIKNSFTFEGRWVEGSSSSACGSMFKGSEYWGTIVISFDEKYSTFDAKWNYCDNEPTQGNWTGMKK